MKNKLLFVSFYTEDYTTPALSLKEQLKSFGKTCFFKKVGDTGSWKRNIRKKPAMIHQFLTKADGYDAIVWLDADAQVLADPVIFDDITEDMAFYFYERKAVGDKEPLGGTMFFRKKQSVQKFLRAWAKKVWHAKMHMKRPDQQYMREMLPKSGLSVYCLPYSYSRLWTDKKQHGGVIRHRRWSMNLENPKVTKLDELEQEARHKELADGRAKRRAEREGRAWYPLHEAKLLGKEAVRKLKDRMARETRERKEMKKRIRREKYKQRRLKA